ncbi:MAG: TonB family protein [Bacteroidales bacterium]|nr:TonB family protein [Bacteroidales bacterium]
MLPRTYKNKIIAAAVTLLLLIVAVLILVFVVHYPPDPPIAERGVEVALGDSDLGLGDHPSLSEPESAPAAPATQTAEEHVSTQTTENTVSVPSSPVKTPAKPVVTPTQPTPQPEQPKQPEVNQNALFKGKNSNNSNNNSSTSSGSSGNTSGSGNMGKPNGNPNSTNYTGDGGGNGTGVGINYSLAGRGVERLQKPTKKDGVQGSITVRIEVDNKGNVVNASIGKKDIFDKDVLNYVLQAARSTKFKPDPSAPEVQLGTITYHYTF